MEVTKVFFYVFCLFFGEGALRVEGAQFLDSNRRFVLEYTEAWEPSPQKGVDPQAMNDADRVMSSKTRITLRRKNADDKYHATFSIVVDDLNRFKGTGIGQLKAYQDYALNFLRKQNFGNFIVSARTLPHVVEPGFELVANQRDFGVSFRQVVFIHENEAYLLTAATRTSKFESYEAEIQNLMNSFRFTPSVGR